MPGQCPRQFSARHIPDPYHPVPAAGDACGCIRQESEAPDGGCESFARGNKATLCKFPDSEVGVFPGTGKVYPVRADRKDPDRWRVHIDGSDKRAVFPGEDADPAVSSPGNYPGATRTGGEGKGCYCTGGARERTEEFPGGNAPECHGAISPRSSKNVAVRRDGTGSD